MSLYDVARELCHEQGMPWYDPRTGQRHDPPDVKAARDARLIAAAPNLLRLLKLALEDIGADEHCCKAAPDSWHPHAISLIRSIEGGAQ